MLKETEHTPGPWEHHKEADDTAHIFSDDYGSILTIHRTSYNPTDVNANAARIASCVNALEGIEDPATFIRTVGHVAYALTMDARTADGMTKDAAAATLRAALAKVTI